MEDQNGFYEVLSDLGTAAGNFFSSKNNADAEKAKLAAAKQAGKLPAWLLPVGIGVALIIGAVVLIKALKS